MWLNKQLNYWFHRFLVSQIATDQTLPHCRTMSSYASPRYPDLESHVSIVSDGHKEQWDRVACDSSSSVPKGRDEEATLGHNTDITIRMIRFCVAGTFHSPSFAFLAGALLLKYASVPHSILGGKGTCWLHTPRHWKWWGCNLTQSGVTTIVLFHA